MQHDGRSMTETLEHHLYQTIRRATGARQVRKIETIQSLWSGYGSLDRYALSGGTLGSVVVKHVRIGDSGSHPQGWNTDRSHQRKLHSYRVETHWYEDWAGRCGDACRVPHCLMIEHFADEVIMVLEDLDASGYPVRQDHADAAGVQACLRWLADFHARFMGERPTGLWPVGTYWHLATRPDELARMEAGALQRMASQIDRCLNDAPYQTLVHGDAKLANFCFSRDGRQVAAVDFQYVGGGCGMKDVAYFISSCFHEAECEQLEAELLDTYFAALRASLARYRQSIDADQLEAAWRPLYAVAWADFYRFLKGWSPGHWKIHGYSERIAQQVVGQLGEAS